MVDSKSVSFLMLCMLSTLARQHRNSSGDEIIAIKGFGIFVVLPRYFVIKSSVVELC